MISIESQTGHYKAVLDDVEDGISVAIWQRIRRGEGFWRPLGRETHDAPFHVVCDWIADRINTLTPDVSAWPSRHSVRSIIR